MSETFLGMDKTVLYLLAKTVPNQILCNSFICCWLDGFFVVVCGLEVPDCTSLLDVFDTTVAVHFLALFCFNPKTERVIGRVG